MRKAIVAALAGFAAGGSTRERARELLGALGYRSERTEDLGGVDGFLAVVEEKNPLTDRQRRLFDAWHSADIIFQITEEDISGNRTLFQEFEPGRAKSFLFVSADLKERHYTRTELAEMTRAVNRGFEMPVILLFRHGESLTLAAIHHRAHKRDSGRNVLEKVTLVKDIRTGDPHRAQVEILADLALPVMRGAGVRSFDNLHLEWERVLDIETLNRRFYRELFDWFERARDACRFPDDGAGDGSEERHVIRLITRLLFVWFMKEKGLIPDRLFDEEFASEVLKNHAPDRTDYYRAVLQNLFFATLNTEIDKRAFSKRSNATHRDFTKYRYSDMLADPDGLMKEMGQIPFVNGGLFDCLDDFAATGQGGRRIDVFTDNQTQGQNLKVPAHLFFDQYDGLFTLFRNYKFTIEENTPLDREVALDPELLGRAFENLLAAYNPETRETARKATGSYYTPRQVVDYMVGGALAAALAEIARPTVEGEEFWRDRLSYLLNWEHAKADAGGFFEPEEAESLVRAIAGLRVLDPAAGSGAFPMGVLHRLTLALRRLDPDNVYWEKVQKGLAGSKAFAAFHTDESGEAARERELLDISRTFETYRDSDFGRKLYLIQNVIYGVDIQPIACQIAKLRFFISLVVEQKTNNDSKNNYGVRPLPNLETRFVAADALIGLGVARQEVLRGERTRLMEDRLRHVRERYFNARTRTEKLKLRDEDERIREELAQELEADFGPDDARAIAAWDPYDHNNYAEWFDPEWMFGTSDGFDIVIGNPPYVRADFPDDRHKQTRKAISDRGDYETLWEKWDLFVPFIERGYKLLTTGGFTTMIVSDAYCHAKYAQKSQEWFLQNSCIVRLDFLSKIKIFDASVHNMIFLFRKVDGGNNRPERRVHSPEFGTTSLLKTSRQKQFTHRAFFPEENDTLQFNSPTVTLEEVCYVSVGMVVHANEKLAKGAFELKDLVADRRDKKHSKQFVEGKHLARWTPTKNRWLEWGTARAPSLFRRPTFPELYEVDEKLISVDMAANANKLIVSYDDKQTYHNHSAWSFVPWRSLSGVQNRSIKKQARYRNEKPSRPDLPQRENLEAISRRFSIKFLLGIMNSSVAREFLRANRRSNIHLYPDDWKKLPIPDVSPKSQKPIIDLVECILATKVANPDADVSAEEEKIDDLVRNLYGLTKT